MFKLSEKNINDETGISKAAEYLSSTSFVTGDVPDSMAISVSFDISKRRAASIRDKS